MLDVAWDMLGDHFKPSASIKQELADKYWKHRATWPCTYLEADGGLGLSRLSASLIFEQLSAGCVATTAFLTIHNMASWMLASFADQALKDSGCRA